MGSSAQPTNSPLNTPLQYCSATVRLFHRIFALHIFRRTTQCTDISDRDREPFSRYLAMEQNPEVLDHAWVYGDMQHGEEYRWSIRDKRGEDRAGMAMCSVIAEVHHQQPQVRHEGLKDGDC